MSRPTTTLERLTAVEIKVDSHGDMLASIDAQQKLMLAELNRYKGFWGAISLVISAVVILGGFAKDWLIAKMGLR
ncbi:MAG TPA: hypothetical protein VE222_04315 [Nitrospiraceae bacterium]|jgi:hypothetical protein|nr:hypothetical protein [Nitrospiraceae bacterium]